MNLWHLSNPEAVTLTYLLSYTDICWYTLFYDYIMLWPFKLLVWCFSTFVFHGVFKFVIELYLQLIPPFSFLFCVLSCVVLLPFTLRCFAFVPYNDLVLPVLWSSGDVFCLHLPLHPANSNTDPRHDIRWCRHWHRVLSKTKHDQTTWSTGENERIVFNYCYT